MFIEYNGMLNMRTFLVVLVLLCHIFSFLQMFFKERPGVFLFLRKAVLFSLTSAHFWYIFNKLEPNPPNPLTP